MNDKDREELRYNSKEKTDDIVVSVIQTTEKKQIKEEKSISVFGLLVQGVRETAKGETNVYQPLNQTEVEKPKMVNTLRMFYVSVFITVLLLCAYFFIDLVTLLPMLVFYGAVFVPMLAVSFFSELNMRKDVKPIWVLFALTIGMILYLILSSLSEDLVVEFSINIITRDMLFIFINVIKFVIALLLVRFFKLSNPFASFVVIVALYMGYSFAENIHVLFESMFVQVSMGEGGNIGVEILIYNSQYLETSFRNLISALFSSAIYMSILNLCLAVIVAYVLAIAQKAITEGKEYARSIYLLVMLGIMMYSFGVSESVSDVVRYIMNGISIVSLLLLSLRCVNMALAEEKFIIKDDRKQTDK